MRGVDSVVSNLHPYLKVKSLTHGGEQQFDRVVDNIPLCNGDARRYIRRIESESKLSKKNLKAAK